MLALHTLAADGEMKGYRLVSNIARHGFLLSPAITTEEDWLRLHYAEPQPRIVKVRVVAASPWQVAMFKPAMRVGFSTIALPGPVGAQRPAELGGASDSH